MAGGQVVCGSCAHPVAEGRCPVCRQTRAHLGDGSLSYAAIAAVVLLLVALAVLVGR